MIADGLRPLHNPEKTLGYELDHWSSTADAKVIKIARALSNNDIGYVSSVAHRITEAVRELREVSERCENGSENLGTQPKGSPGESGEI